jgi:hypothetical protein
MPCTLEIVSLNKLRIQALRSVLEVVSPITNRMFALYVIRLMFLVMWAGV